ncbi:GTPase obg [Clonorchis sinensis]|uniref:GTPase obg n=1 Tax=Clonorchis sinensis TaxID=79923 RepID=H2KS15_CLOSI|nr:GTPase obg [Clonorchis sinensis]
MKASLSLSQCASKLKYEVYSKGLCTVHGCKKYLAPLSQFWVGIPGTIRLLRKSARLYADSSFVVRHELKKRAPGHTPRAFVNLRRIVVEAGNGGDGCIAFERLFCNPNGGPSGGDGGNGGHIILQASQHITDLSHIPSIIRGENGANGYPSNCNGANGAHTYIQVPVGTQVYQFSGSKNDTEDDLDRQLTLINFLNTDTAVCIVARGGAGGKGNAFLTSSATATDTRLSSNRNPPLRVAERGARGDHRRLLLRMSELAHLGLVGAPNAGKSSLLRRLTRARPKVAPYPFTTLEPQMGVLANHTVQDTQPHLTIADLPGLIRGAAEYDAGLGARFLSLVADCRLLMLVVDIGTIWKENGLESRDDWRHELHTEVLNQLLMLRHELVTFDRNLGDTERCMVVGTKLDLILPHPLNTKPDNDCLGRDLIQQLNKVVGEAATDSEVLTNANEGNVVIVSARRGDNIDILMHRLSLLAEPRED